MKKFVYDKVKPGDILKVLATSGGAVEEVIVKENAFVKVLVVDINAEGLKYRKLGEQRVTTIDSRAFNNNIIGGVDGMPTYFFSVYEPKEYPVVYKIKHYSLKLISFFGD